MNKNIKMYFDGHTGKNVLYFTTDGQCFFNQGDAAANSQALEKKKKGDGAISGIPSVVTAWYCYIGSDTGFIRVYVSAGYAFPTRPNPLVYNALQHILTHTPPHACNDGNIDDMGNANSYYGITYSVITSHMLLWNPLSSSTIQFEDVNGNFASGTPLVIFPEDDQTPIDSLQPAITVERVSGDDMSITLRLTASHVAPVAIEVGSIAMTFIDEAFAATPDPADPTNTNKCIVVCDAGTHQFGVIGQYLYTDGTTVLGYSMVEMCVEVA